MLTQLYGHHLRGHGADAAQFTLLFALSKLQGKSQVALTRVLDLDKTTLSRNLKLLRGKGLIESATVKGQREPGLFLTRAGQQFVAEAKPAWTKAQAELRGAMSGEEWEAMWKAFHHVTRVVHALNAAHDG